MSESKPPADPSAVPSAILEELQREFVQQLHRLLTFVGIPFVVLGTAVEALKGHFRVGFAVEMAILAGLWLSTSSRIRSHRAPLSWVAILLLTMTVLGLVNFGPTAGIGTVFAGSTLLCTFFWGIRGSVAAFAVLGVAYAAVAVASIRGELAVEFAPSSGMVWMRQGLTVFGVMALVATMFVSIQRSFLRAVAAEAAARERERWAEEERARALQANLRSQRLESLGRLAGGIAHDVNNSLTAILLSADELLYELGDAHPGSALVTQIVDAVSRAASTSNQLVAFSKGPHGDHDQSCRARSVVPKLVTAVRRAVPEHIAFEVQMDEADGAVPMSAGSLEQAILNLVINARDAMPEGGTLRLSVRRDADRKEDVIAVQDDGVGMTPDVAERVFEPFFSTKAERGNGLGLAMVWGTVTGAGGSVEVASHPGAGSTFTLRLPVAPESNRVPVPSPSGDAADGLAGVTILVLEDEPAVLRGLRAVLDRVGARTLAAPTVAEARGLLAAHGDVRLLITDAIVPGGGVPELIADFRRTHPGRPVLMCSGHIDPELENDLRAARPTETLRKPVGSQELLAAVRRMLA